MSEHVFRNDQLLQTLPYREYMRRRFPNGREGFVVEDLDLLVRVYGRRYQTDETGRVMFTELKFGNAWIGTAQANTWKPIHLNMRRGDPSRTFYRGFYVVQYDKDDWEEASFRINRQPVSRDDFHRFLEFQDIGVTSLWDDVLVPRALLIPSIEAVANGRRWHVSVDDGVVPVQLQLFT